jgi:hypothetical protein
MSVVIACDSFLALRNVRNGDLGRRLAGDRVIAWVDPHQVAGSRAAQPEGVELGCLEDFDPVADKVLGPLLRRAYLARKCFYDPVTEWAEQRLSSARRNRRNRVRRYASVGRAAVTLAGYWAAGRLGLAPAWRRRFGAALRAHPVVERYRRRLREVGATAVLALSPEGCREMALIEAGNSLGLVTAVMIRSRDNLASKIQHLPDAGAYFVWSQATRQFFAHLYPEIPRERVHAVGSPQFDHHLDPDRRLDRKAFFARMRLDPARPLVVYSMATPGLLDHEIDIAQHLADAAHAGKLHRGAQLLVRGHPRMFGSDVRLLHREYPEARSYPAPTDAPYRSAEHEARVVQLLLEDEPVHLATLAHQDVQVNACGTMTIDSSIFDRPVVNVYYDLVDVPYGLSVRRAYARTDVQEMMSYGASRLAHTPADGLALINRYLDEPQLDAAGRRRAREEDCGPLDGEAGARIAQLLMALGGRRTPQAAAV